MHCVKSVQIRSFFWSVFSCIRTEYGDLDTFHAVMNKSSRQETHLEPCRTSMRELFAKTDYGKKTVNCFAKTMVHGGCLTGSGIDRT